LKYYDWFDSVNVWFFRANKTQCDIVRAQIKRQKTQGLLLFIIITSFNFNLIDEYKTNKPDLHEDFYAASKWECLDLTHHLNTNKANL